jgi:hypothetical protein
MTSQLLADDGHVWARLVWCSRAGTDRSEGLMQAKGDKMLERLI